VSRTSLASALFDAKYCFDKIYERRLELATRIQRCADDGDLAGEVRYDSPRREAHSAKCSKSAASAAFILLTARTNVPMITAWGICPRNCSRTTRFLPLFGMASDGIQRQEPIRPPVHPPVHPPRRLITLSPKRAQSRCLQTQCSADLTFSRNNTFVLERALLTTGSCVLHSALPFASPAGPILERRVYGSEGVKSGNSG